jgi:hypothetical protein
MSRPRKPENADLPPRLRQIGHAFYFATFTRPRRWIALGSERGAALARWAVLYAEGTGGTVPPVAGTFAAVADRYRAEVMPGKAARTRSVQDRQLSALVEVFGHMPVRDIVSER